MRYLLTIACAGLALALCAECAAAEPKSGNGGTKMVPLTPNLSPLIPNLQPLIPGQQPAQSATPAQNPANTASSDLSGVGLAHCPSYPVGIGFPYSHYAYGYTSNYGYGSDVYYYRSYYPYSDYYLLAPSTSYPLILPPLVVPPELFFGPQAGRPFIGAANSARPPIDGNADAGRNDDTDREPAPNKAMERGTNAQSIASAWKYIGYGDALFVKHNYAGASDRYRKATNIAPQLAEAWFRHGFALVASSHYELAVRAIQRGLNIDRSWPDSAFHLNDLYGIDAATKTAHMETLAEAAENSPNDANVLFLIGVYLHFDGQPRRADNFFHRALELAGDHSEHIRAFLPK